MAEDTFEQDIATYRRLKAAQATPEPKPNERIESFVKQRVYTQQERDEALRRAQDAAGQAARAGTLSR